MSYIDKFKASFQKKYFDTYLTNKDYENLFNEIYKILDKNDLSLLNLINNNLDKILDDIETEKFFPKNITWINSFESKHSTYISKFLEFYFQSQSTENSDFIYDTYENKILENLSKYLKKINIDLNDLSQNSYLYQLIISLKSSKSKIFLNNQMAFFENSQNSKRFSHPFFTNGFIYVVQNPYDLYRNIKVNNSNIIFAQNYLLNLDSSPEIYSQNENRVIEINRKSWNVNLDSWDGEAVVRSFNGIIIKLEDLENDPIDTYASILTHLSQTGLKFDLNYEIIKKFIDLNPIINQAPKIEISNKEMKLIDKEISQKASSYSYLKY